MVGNKYPRRSFNESKSAYIVDALQHVSPSRSVIADLFVHSRLLSVASETNKFAILDFVYWDRHGIGDGGWRMVSKNRLEIGFEIPHAIGAIEGLITSDKKLRFNLGANRARGRLKGL